MIKPVPVFHHPDRASTGCPESEAQNRLQALRLELEQQQKQIQNLQDQVARLEREQFQAGANAISHLLAAAAPALVQIAAYTHLAERQSKDLSAEQVLAAAGRILRALEQYGLRIEPEMDTQAIFDPARHMPLNSMEQLAAGEAVVVRFSGVWFKDRCLRKAGVERREQPL